MEGAKSDESGRRAGMNEAIFREVNEQIRSLTDEVGDDGETITVICECADADCAERLELLLTEYEHVRGDSLLYVIASGHELLDVEQVVAQRNGWEVVRKVGIASEIAEKTDPRS